MTARCLRSNGLRGLRRLPPRHLSFHQWPAAELKRHPEPRSSHPRIRRARAGARASPPVCPAEIARLALDAGGAGLSAGVRPAAFNSTICGSPPDRLQRRDNDHVADGEHPGGRWAAKWLLPRLSAFQESGIPGSTFPHPTTSTALGRLQERRRRCGDPLWGRGHWPGPCAPNWLMADQLFSGLQPGAVDRGQAAALGPAGPRQPCACCTRAKAMTMDWRLWADRCRAARAQHVENKPGLKPSTLISWRVQAAIDGHRRRYRPETSYVSRVDNRPRGGLVVPFKDHAAGGNAGFYHLVLRAGGKGGKAQTCRVAAMAACLGARQRPESSLEPEQTRPIGPVRTQHFLGVGCNAFAMAGSFPTKGSATASTNADGLQRSRQNRRIPNSHVAKPSRSAAPPEIKSRLGRHPLRARTSGNFLEQFDFLFLFRLLRQRPSAKAFFPSQNETAAFAEHLRRILARRLDAAPVGAISCSVLYNRPDRSPQGF